MENRNILLIFVPSKQYNMVTANLCKCNNCNSVLIDQNPQIGANEYELTGKELDMQYIKGSDLQPNFDNETYWGCPICLTDDYLVDL